MKNTGTYRRILLLILLSANSRLWSAEEGALPIAAAYGATDAPPLSVAWLEYWGEKYPFQGKAAAHLVAELVRAKANADSWSARTESELRTAIDSDYVLKRNRWNTVRCSPNGCIAAIDPLPDEKSSSMDSDTIQSFRSHLLSYVTTRKSPSGNDITLYEVDGSHHHLLFFLFPESSDQGSDVTPGQHTQANE